VLASVAALQLAGVSPAGALPNGDASFLHAADQWRTPSYRVAPGPLLDRRGRVLAETRALGAGRSFPDSELARSLGHTLLQLDLGYRERLLGARDGERVGPALRTTIDADVQRAVHSAIDSGATGAELLDVAALRGAVVLLDVADGSIVALESRPTFAPSELSDRRAWASAEAKERRAGFAYRYLNRAVQGFYPPGSIFKTVTAAAALERGLHPLHSHDFDYRHGPEGPREPDGLRQLARWHQLTLPDGPPITDANHPRVRGWNFDLEEAFAWSCNVAFAEIGLELGAADLISLARRFGFERPLAVKGLGASTSTLDNDVGRPLSERYLARSSSNLARTAFGQGQARVTPLQMALVPAAIANDGTIMRPRLLSSEQPRVFSRTGFSATTHEELRELMWASATYGWARSARVNRHNVSPGVAGKTGSAEWSEVQDVSHGWFIGYYPAERPRLAIAVVVERGGPGPIVAARIARGVFQSNAVQRYVREGRP
jgi:peptidoglycan glycosyltransferase